MGTHVDRDGRHRVGPGSLRNGNNVEAADEFRFDGDAICPRDGPSDWSAHSPHEKLRSR
jgi:hypothetical protein